jgi:hypothetical protein
MSASFYRGQWLVYLNGVEVPCPSVTVNYGVNTIPSATFNFPPHRLLERMGSEDRLDVAVFYLDHFASGANDSTFRLLFEGEMVGWSYRSTPAGRMMSFQAIADISAYEQLFYYFINTTETIVGHSFSPPGDDVVQAGVAYPYSLFKYGLIFEPSEDMTQGPVTITRPYDLLMNVVRGMMSKDIPEFQRTRTAVNFFARWARKRNFPNKFFAVPFLEDADPLPSTNAPADTSTQGVFPVFKAVQELKVAEQMRNSLATSVGPQGSIYTVLTQALGLVEFELSMLPTAPAAWVRRDTGRVIGNPEAFDNRDDAAGSELRLLTYSAKPECLFAIPPRCNVIFPSMMTGYSYEENYRDQPTRLYVNDQMYTSTFNDSTGWTSMALGTAYPPEASAEMRRLKFEGGPQSPELKKTGKDVIIFPEEFFKGPVVSRFKFPEWFSMLANVIDRDAGGTSNQASAAQMAKANSMFAQYAKYSYYKQRYSKRGGAVDMGFNPYIVPGYPCVVFDHRASAFDTMGYVLNVSHSLDASGGGSMRTNINYGYGRTLHEVLSQIPIETYANQRNVHSAPADPVASVGLITQEESNASAFYSRLFYQGNTPKYGPAISSFELRNAVVAEGNPDLIKSAYTVTPVPETGNATSVAGREFYENLGRSLSRERDVKLVPTESFKPYFADYDSAMRYVSRPVCSLTDYIRFYSGGTVPDKIRAKRTLFEGTNAYYYPVIRVYNDGPADRPPDSVIGASVSPSAEGFTAVVADGLSGAVGPTFPETRDNWTSRIKKYRDEILGILPLR